MQGVEQWAAPLKPVYLLHRQFDETGPPRVQTVPFCGRSSPLRGSATSCCSRISSQYGTANMTGAPRNGQVADSPWQQIFLRPLATGLERCAGTVAIFLAIVVLQLCARGFAARTAELGPEPLRAFRVEAMILYLALQILPRGLLKSILRPTNSTQQIRAALRYDEAAVLSVTEQLA